MPQARAKSVRVSTFLYQVRGEILTHPSDIQTSSDNIPVAEKKLHGSTGQPPGSTDILGSSFAPSPMLDWFAKYMA